MYYIIGISILLVYVAIYFFIRGAAKQDEIKDFSEWEK